MDIITIESSIQKDLAWRKKEIGLFAEQLNQFRPSETIVNSTEATGHDEIQSELTRVENDKKRFRKALVLIMYAHFEGFFRFAFKLYVEALNEEQIELSEAIDVLTAASLNAVFQKYSAAQHPEQHDSDQLSKQTKRIKRRVDLLKRIEELRSEGKVKLPISNIHSDDKSVIYTESNLKFEVIEKIFYHLGLSIDSFRDEVSREPFKKVLNQFIQHRNKIAHGDGQAGVSDQDYEKFKTVFDRVTQAIPSIITITLSDQLYLKETFRDSPTQT